MMFEKAGEIAGAIWTALNENGAMSAKDLKKAAKVKTEKEMFLGLGWLLREDKLSVAGDEKEPTFSLK
ncbi:MAG: winged helix-turn-helix domain-containing protein [Bacteroidaceae bacterium]|nr:winged helix-turn-helix domain-containing protein [Bacteroidaceae bacterium]